MIGRLRFGKTANFYKKRKRLPKAAIGNVFGSIRGDLPNPSQYLFRHVKESLHASNWSAISFFYDRDPAFLSLPANHARERVCGFLLLIEYRDHAVIFKAGLDLPAEFKTEFLTRIPLDRVEAAIAKADATFEKMNLRAMAASPMALFSKTLEGSDLKAAINPLGGSRYVPRSYRVRRGAERISTIPNTGRISARSDRINYDELIDWAVTTIDALIDEHAAPSPFLRIFAAPLDLSSLSATTRPIHIGFDVGALTERLFDLPNSEKIELFRSNNGVPMPLPMADVQAVLSALDRTFPIREVRREIRIEHPDTHARIGALTMGKTAITLPDFDITETTNVFVRSFVPAPGAQADKKVSLKTYINRNDLLTVLFTDLSIVYINGSLYRDSGIQSGGETLLAHILPYASMDNVVSEKGNLAAGQIAFDGNSVFGAIINDITASDSVLVCDDLGNEWADFIGIDAHSQPKKISFYHAKHHGVSLGAQPLHVVVSQAIKNLANVGLADDAVVAKAAFWNAPYENQGAVTAIPRLIRGAAATIQQNIKSVNAAPDTIRRVFLVTSSLSRASLEAAFADIAQGIEPAPHFVQLYWLLMSYIGACREIGAFPYVVSRQ